MAIQSARTVSKPPRIVESGMELKAKTDRSLVVRFVPLNRTVLASRSKCYVVSIPSPEKDKAK